MKVFDCFTFFNEVDLLDFRLRLLDNVVDYFVICESNLTFSGKEKPYNFANNISKFSKWKDKIIYLPIEQSTEGLLFENVETYTPTNGPWMLESQQRFALSHINSKVNDDDYVLLGDIDEIPNPNALKQFRGMPSKEIPIPLVFSQLFHYYYMNCQNEGHERWWNGTMICNGKSFKELDPQGLRDRRNHSSVIRESGWHFSYLGGVEKIRTKIQSFSHTEFNRPDIVSDDNIIEAMEKGLDVLKRPGVVYKFHHVDDYPKDLRTLMMEYPQFIKQI